jgi:phosphatidate cytidylyltransferase
MSEHAQSDDEGTHATRANIEKQFEATLQQFEHANEVIQARTGRNLLGAIFVASVLGGLLLLSLLVEKQLFVIFGAVLLGVSAFEFATALRHLPSRVPRTPAVITALVAVPVAYYVSMLAATGVILAGILLTILWRAIESAAGFERATSVQLRGDFLAATFVQLYVTLLGCFAVALVAHPEGQWWALAFLITVVCVDTGAYVTGMLLGKHPMAPAISPKKTWEGFAGGAVLATVAAILLSLFMLDQPWWFGIIFGLIIVGTATAGDLLESSLKRTIGIKDMSVWLAGHGGFLDRLDSILPSAVATYVLYWLVMGL